MGDAAQRETLRARVIRGAAWKLVSQIFLQTSGLVVAIILARLLTPDDYGLAGMVIAFSAIVYVFSDLALGAALVQRRVLDERDRSTVFWTSAAAGLLFTATGWLASGPIADFYGEPEVQPLFAALSLSFFVTSVGATQKALLTRELDFRRLELRAMSGAAAGAVVGITLAAAGYGAWAIIGQQLTIASTSTVLLWAVSPWRPRLMFSLGSLRALGGFSGNVFATRVLFYVSRTADNILIGRFLGAGALGVYAVAYNVMLAPIDRIAGPVQDVLFPAFSRIQDDRRRVASVWLRVNRVVAAITLPAMAGMMIMAPDFVRVVLGAKWEAATPVIQILAWVGALQSLQRMNSSVLQARDRTRTLLGFAALVATANVIGFIVGMRWGIVGIATAYAAVNTFLQPFYTWLTARSIGVSLADCARNVNGVLQATILMGVVVLGLRVVLVDAGAPPAIRLAAAVLAGIPVFVAATAWRAPEALRELARLRRRRGPEKLAPRLSES